MGINTQFPPNTGSGAIDPNQTAAPPPPSSGTTTPTQDSIGTASGSTQGTTTQTQGSGTPSLPPPTPSSDAETIGVDGEGTSLTGDLDSGKLFARLWSLADKTAKMLIENGYDPGQLLADLNFNGSRMQDPATSTKQQAGGGGGSVAPADLKPSDPAGTTPKSTYQPIPLALQNVPPGVINALLEAMAEAQQLVKTANNAIAKYNAGDIAQGEALDILQKYNQALSKAEEKYAAAAEHYNDIVDEKKGDIKEGKDKDAEKASNSSLEEINETLDMPKVKLPKDISGGKGQSSLPPKLTPLQYPPEIQAAASESGTEIGVYIPPQSSESEGLLDYSDIPPPPPRRDLTPLPSNKNEAPIEQDEGSELPENTDSEVDDREQSSDIQDQRTAFTAPRQSSDASSDNQDNAKSQDPSFTVDNSKDKTNVASNVRRPDTVTTKDTLTVGIEANRTAPSAAASQSPVDGKNPVWKSIDKARDMIDTVNTAIMKYNNKEITQDEMIKALKSYSENITAAEVEYKAATTVYNLQVKNQEDLYGERATRFDTKLEMPKPPDLAEQVDTNGKPQETLPASLVEFSFPAQLQDTNLATQPGWQNYVLGR